jgi:hypothetical protein
MRWVWALAIVCLMAATSVRPLRIKRHDPHVAQLDAATGAVARVARREATHLPDLRLAPFVLAQAPSTAAPVMVADATNRPLTSCPATCAADTPRARGPPIA